MCWKAVSKGTEDRVRVTAQLIDALKGHHLWAERYDRELKGFFPVQDENRKSTDPGACPPIPDAGCMLLPSLHQRQRLRQSSHAPKSAFRCNSCVALNKYELCGWHFCLDKPDHLRNRVFRWYRDQNMHMVRLKVPFQYLALLLPG